jgi:hypothetical protein
VTSQTFADAVAESFAPPATRVGIEARGADAVAVFEPRNPGACSVRVVYQPQDELLSVRLGPEQIPVELSLTGPVGFDDVRSWLGQRVEAVFAGRYEQERTLLRDGSLVSVVGTFHLDDGDVRHVFRRRLGWFRRKRQERLTFAPYG